jgi:hypothetical protein
MKRYHQLFIALVLVSTITGCLKEVLVAATENNDCSLNGNQLSWQIGGSEMCADTFLEADFGGQVMSINGISGIVSSLTMSLEDTEVGTHDFNGSSNFMLLTQLGFPWVSSDTLPGTFEITAHDPAVQNIAGTFQVDLLNELSNDVKSIEGVFNVDYSSN